MCCDKSETIRMLSLHLGEIQDQYNDCFSEAAKQETTLELHRDAIQSLHKTIICKDLVNYSLSIKAQELFRDHIRDVRVVKSKMDDLVRSRRYLEEKCRRIKQLWREADRELRKIKCMASCEASSQQESQCKDCFTRIDSTEFGNNMEMQSKVNLLLRENEDLKMQLQNRRLEFELFDQQVKNQLNSNKRIQELTEETAMRLRDTEHCLVEENRQLESVLKEHQEYSRILIAELQLARERETLKTDLTSSAEGNTGSSTIKDELCRRTVELDNLIEEAKQKHEELEMFQDMRKDFKRSEDLERSNECLKKELSILRETIEKECCLVEKVQNEQTLDNTEVDRIVSCDEAVRPREKEIQVIRRLKDQLLSTRELTEECLGELRASKEMLSFLRQRICSLKRLLKEKSDEMAKLQADHQMIKNDYSILKTETGILEEKARAEIQQFREKLKALYSELHIVEENYQRVSQDFGNSQELLIEAAQREVELQQAITATEKIFYSELTSAETEGKRVSQLVDILRADLENAREEFSTREEHYMEKCRDAYEQVTKLEDRINLLEESKHVLARQLQECRIENCSLIAENTQLTENVCRCAKELEETHNALLELKGQCKTKTKTLNSVSAELNHVAASRSELCDESQRVVACIRSWIDEQRRLVENLSKKLKNEKNRIAQYAFEKKALVATVRELTRVNGTLSELSTMRRKISPERDPSRYCSRPNRYKTSTWGNRTQQPVTSSTTSVYTRRPLKRRCVCLTRTSRRTLLRGNSWWFPKLEHLSQELSNKNRQNCEKTMDGWESETSMDETRDFGYQSSAGNEQGSTWQ